MLPHIAVLSKLAKTQSLEILYVGSKGGPEQGIMEAWGRQLGGQNSQADCPMKFRFVSIPVGKLRRYFDLHNFIDPFKVVMGFFKSLWLVARFKPDVLFSKGGYVSAPVTLAAWVLRVPIVLHDSDAKPSLTTRLCGRFAKQICLGYKEALVHLSPALQKKCVVTGIPLRREIFEGKKKEGYKMTGFTSKKPVVLVMGGSLGSEKINHVVEEAMPELLKMAQIVHLTGVMVSNGVTLSLSKGDRDNAMVRPFDGLTAGSAHNDASYKPFSSLPNEKMPHLYAIADVVVTRAGANSLAELTALRKKMIVIPLGSAASHGDQLANAAVLKKGDTPNAVVIEEERLTAKRLVDTLKLLLTKGKS